MDNYNQRPIGAKKNFLFSSSEEKLNVINKSDEMSDSDSEYEETGISNPSFDDKITNSSATVSSDSITNSKQSYSKSKKSFRGIDETSFATSSEELLTRSTVKAEKPYESEVSDEKIKRKKKSREARQIVASTSQSDESVPSLFMKLEESAYTLEKSKKSKSSTDQSDAKPRIRKPKSISSLDLSENTNLTDESREISSIKSSSTGKFEKMRRKLLKRIDSDVKSRSESTISSSRLECDSNESSEKNNKELSSGEVIQDEPKKRRKKVRKKTELKNIPEEHEETEETKTKPRKKKKKTVSKESIQSESTEESKTEDDDLILAILIHRIDGFKMHYFISHPLVQVHLFDLNSGTYISKRKNSKPVISYYEEESSPVNYILPVMTQPYEIKGKRNMTPEWQELLVFNEKLSYFTKDEPNVLIFFEVLDFISMAQASKQYNKLGKDGGWHRVAWAFLKVVGGDNVLNIGRKIRLQLYYPLKKRNFLCTSKVSKNMFGWWNNNSKKKYPYTLYVTIKGIEAPKVEPSLRSMIPTQEEKGRTTVDDLQRVLEGKSPNLSEERITTSQTEMETVRWSRLPGQLCKIPTKLHRKIHVGKSASCFVVKFSTNGRYLACGSMESTTTHSILIYEIPSGQFKSKCCYHFGLIYDLAWNSSDSQLLSSSTDCTARLWQLEKGKSQSFKILPHPSYVYSGKFHPRAARIVVTACYDHVVRVWDCAKEECELMQELSHHIKFVNAVCFDEEGDTLFSGDGLGMVCLWNAYVTSQPNKPALTRDWTLKQNIKSIDLQCKVINDIVLHPGGRRVLVSTRDNCLRLFDSRDFTLIQKYDGHQNMLDYIHCTITPCGSLVLSGSEDGTVHIWNTNSGTKVHTFSSLPFDKTVCSVHYHPYEHMFVCCSYGENVPALIYIHEQDAQSISLPLHDMSFHQPPVPVPSLPASGILKSSRSQSLNISSTSEISSTATPSLDEEEGSDFSDECKVKPRKLKSKLRGKTSSSSVISSLKSSTVQSRSVTFQDEVQPVANKWQKVLDKFNDIIDSSSKTSTLIDDFSFLSTNETTDSSIECKVVALYSYKARNESELNLKPGDVICVKKEINGNWWEGVAVNGSKGMFPANYVYRIDDTSYSDTSENQAKMATKSKEKKRKTHVIMSTSGNPIFLSASEDDTLSSH